MQGYVDAGMRTEKVMGWWVTPQGGQGGNEARRGLATRQTGPGNRGRGPAGRWAKVSGALLRAGLRKGLAQSCLSSGWLRAFLGSSGQRV